MSDGAPMLANVPEDAREDQMQTGVIGSAAPPHFQEGGGRDRAGAGLDTPPQHAQAVCQVGVGGGTQTGRQRAVGAQRLEGLAGFGAAPVGQSQPGCRQVLHGG